MKYSNLREERKNVTKKKEEKTHINYLMIGFSLKDVVFKVVKGLGKKTTKKEKYFTIYFRYIKIIVKNDKKILLKNFQNGVDSTFETFFLNSFWRD
jgi:hypothetical protein